LFLGSHQHSIDEKGRLTLPSKWRAELAGGVVVTRGLDGCLFIFPQAKFEQMAQAIDAQGFESADARDWERYIFGMAEQVDIDKQGRILIPQNLRSHFKLQSDVVVVGLNTRIEVWEPAKYIAMTERVESDPAVVAERMRVMMRGAG
jgi:MraZ protein